MLKDEILSKLEQIFREIFDNQDLSVTRATDASQIEGWDSFMHINLIVAIEENFEVSFTTKEIGQFSCVGDVIDLLATKAS